MEIVDNKELLLLEQMMAYLRECHGHLITLTGRVVAFNIAALAAYGVILNRSAITNLGVLPNLLVVVFGLLVASFGVVFNWGASAAQKHLLLTEENLKKYINEQLGQEVALRSGYNYVMTTHRRGKVAKLTDAFFVFCGLIWLLLGGTISYLAFCGG